MSLPVRLGLVGAITLNYRSSCSNRYDWYDSKYRCRRLSPIVERVRTPPQTYQYNQSEESVQGIDDH